MDSENKSVQSTPDQYPWTMLCDHSGFDLETVEASITGKPIEIKYKPVENYELVYCKDRYDKYYQGVVIEQDDPALTMFPFEQNYRLHEHLPSCSRVGCKERLIHFTGFFAHDREWLPECKLRPYSCCTDRPAKVLLDKTNDQSDHVVDVAKHLQQSYKSLISKVSTIAIGTIVGAMNPSCAPLELFCFRRQIAFYAAATIDRYNIFYLNNIGRFLKGQGITIAKSTSFTLQSFLKYTRLSITDNELISYDCVLLREIFVRFGGLRRIRNDLQWMSVHITDNPHDFELWHALLDIAKQFIISLKPPYDEQWNFEVLNCIEQWIRSCLAFLPAICAFNISVEQMASAILKDDFDGSFSMFEMEFLGRHYSPFHPTIDVGNQTLGYVDMASRWDKTNPYHTTYANHVKSMLEADSDLLPDLLAIVYEYCDFNVK